MNSYAGHAARLRQRAKFESKQISYFLKRENPDWSWTLLTDKSYPSVDAARVAAEAIVKGTDTCCVIVRQVCQYGDSRLTEVEVVQDWDR